MNLVIRVLERVFTIKGVWLEPVAPPQEGKVALELKKEGEGDDVFQVTVIRLTIEDYKALGSPTVGDKIKIKVERA